MRRPTLCALSASAIVMAAGGAGQAAADNWITDAVTGCQVWSVEPPAAEEGVSWSGACTDGKASGAGVLVWWDTRGLVGRYVGNMAVGKLESEGSLFIRAADGDGFHQYIGHFADGRPSGKGFLRKADGTRFVGEAIDGLDHVRGIVLTSDGWLLRGEFRGEQGVGTLMVEYKTSEGERYFGEAENNARHGWGVLRAADEDFYAGRFAEGEPEGPGIYQGKGGDRYFGEFSAGRATGFGTSIDAEGNVIQGRFVNGEPEGKVLVTLPDGIQEVTEWSGGDTQ
jgi:hypothetical protein